VPLLHLLLKNNFHARKKWFREIRRNGEKGVYGVLLAYRVAMMTVALTSHRSTTFYFIRNTMGRAEQANHRRRRSVINHRIHIILAYINYIRNDSVYSSLCKSSGRIVETYVARSPEKLPLQLNVVVPRALQWYTRVINCGEGGEFIIVIYLFFFIFNTLY